MPQANISTGSAVPALHAIPAKLLGADLENVELLMALEAQNLMGSGFDNSVRRAAQSIGAEFLFNIPAPSSLPFQRAALVRLPEGSGQIVLVTLSSDGVTMEDRKSVV